LFASNLTHRGPLSDPEGGYSVEQLLGQSVIPFGELLWRFGVASAFGLLLGLDREVRGISAGIRTHMLVALSSAMTMLIALELYEQVAARGQADLDPIRAIQGLAQAIGFLCAGVIFVARGSVYGVTTAASLWMTSSIGMAAGAGMYQIAVAGLIFAMLIVSVLWLVTRFLPGGSLPPPSRSP
jgi:putative Mg2+ transporter-C (MgtC) family protein